MLINSQVLADRADSSDFQINGSREQREQKVVMCLSRSRHVIGSHETKVASAGGEMNVGSANTERSGLSVRKTSSVFTLL